MPRSHAVRFAFLFLTVALPGCASAGSTEALLAARRNAAPVIVIDPGHGGTSKIAGSSANNARGPGGLLEKDVALQIGVETAEILTRRGFQVHVTRNSDKNLSLKERAKVALDRQATAFVSIHLNGNADPRVQGTEAWVHRTASGDSRLLGSSLLQQVAAATGHRNRGLWTGAVDVVSLNHHWPTTAASLVEISFLSDPAEEARLRTQAYRTRIASAIAQGIQDFVNRSSSIPVVTPTAGVFDHDDPEP